MVRHAHDDPRVEIASRDTRLAITAFPAGLALAFLLLHIPYLPSSLEDLDSVNFALGIRDYDVARHQPHPPGYPLFVALAKTVHLVVPSEATALALVSVIAGALGILALGLLFRHLEGERAPGIWWIAAMVVTMTAPLYWFTAARPLSDSAGLAAALTVQALTLRARSNREFATAAGGAAFKVNCVQCHGSGAQGSPGFPNLNDDDWLWGGTILDLHKTISNGVRSDHKETRTSQMPRYGLDKLMDDGQINDAAEFVLSLSGKSSDLTAVARGEKVFAEQCASCHGPQGKGQQEQGAPNLTDEIWLYGGTKPAIVESIRTGRGGMMPAWAGRLDPITIKALTVYVHSLGGGV